jgi:hypothetical protein
MLLVLYALGQNCLIIYKCGWCCLPRSCYLMVRRVIQIFFFEQCHCCLTLIKQLYFINRTYICTSYVLGCNILLNIIVFSVVDLFTAIYHLLVGSLTPVLAVVESGLLWKLKSCIMYKSRYSDELGSLDEFIM